MAVFSVRPPSTHGMTTEQQIKELENTIIEMIDKLRFVTSRLNSGNVKRLDAAETTITGVVHDNAVAYQADSVAADVATLKTDFNSLLSKLKTADVMAES